jgi:hypothetical protein
VAALSRNLYSRPGATGVMSDMLATGTDALTITGPVSTRSTRARQELAGRIRELKLKKPESSK